MDERVLRWHAWRQLPGVAPFVGSSRSKHAAVSVGDGLFIHGGDSGSTMLGDMLRFDIQDHSWSSCQTVKGDCPSPRYHHSAVVYDSAIYCFGGYTGDIFSNSNLENRNDLYQHLPDKGMWRPIHLAPASPTPPARSAHCCAMYGSWLYVFAGFDGSDRLNDMWRVDLSAEDKRWEPVLQRGDVPAPCCNMPCAISNTTMFIFSGMSGKFSSNQLHAFEFATHTWSRIEYLSQFHGGGEPPTRRFGHTMVHHNGKLWIFGGCADNALTNSIYRFDLDRRLWHRVQAEESPFTPSGRCFHSACVRGNTMFVFGGTLDVSHSTRSGHMFSLSLTDPEQPSLLRDVSSLLSDDVLVDLFLQPGRCSLPSTTAEPTAHTHKSGTAPAACCACACGTETQRNDGQCWVRCHTAIVAARSDVLRARIRTALEDRRRKRGCHGDTSQGAVAPRKESDESQLLKGDDDMWQGTPGGSNMTDNTSISRECSGVHMRAREQAEDSENACPGVADSGEGGSGCEDGTEGSGERGHQQSGEAVEGQAESSETNDAEGGISGRRSSGASQDSTVNTQRRHMLRPMPSHPLYLHVPEASSKTTLAALVHFCYADSLPENFDVGLTTSSCVERLLDLCDLADALHIPRLHALCVNCLRLNTRVENALSLLQAVTQRDMLDVRQHLLDFVLRPNNYRRVVMSPEFEALPRDVIVELVRQHELTCTTAATARLSSSYSGSTTATASLSRQTSSRALLDFPGVGEGQRPEDLQRALARLFDRVLSSFALDDCDAVSRTASESKHDALLDPDTLVHFEGGTCRVHSCIVAARCAYFASLFRSGMVEAQALKARLQLGDRLLSASAAKHLLCYIYLSQVESPSPQDAVVLASCADYFSFTTAHLHDACHKRIQAALSTANAVAVLKAAARVHNEDAMEQAMAIIVKSLSEVSQQVEFESLDKPLLLMVLKRVAEAGHPLAHTRHVPQQQQHETTV